MASLHQPRSRPTYAHDEVICRPQHCANVIDAIKSRFLDWGVNVHVKCEGCPTTPKPIIFPGLSGYDVTTTTADPHV